MNRALKFALPCSVLLAYAVASAACTSFAVAPSRPAPSPAPTPPSSEPLPAPASPPPSQPATEALPRAAPAPGGSPAAAPRPQSDASSASSALLQQSRAQRAAGSLPTAKASLERALRLDPNNPEVWLELGEVELQTGNAAQAATMARKALTLAGRNSGVAVRANRLLRDAE